jgi:hypothetical protein
LFANDNGSNDSESISDLRVKSLANFF